MSGRDCDNGIEPDEMSSRAYTAAVDERLAAHAGSAGAMAAMSFAQLHNPVGRFSLLPLTSHEQLAFL